MGRARGEVHDAAEAILASIEDKLAAARASGQESPLIHDLQQFVNEIRAALQRTSCQD
jgi:2-methylisocitrate lyase-like PEP mutase family enzyme